MSDPATATPEIPMRARLAMAMDPFPWQSNVYSRPSDRDADQQLALAKVDAILREMLEPSAGMIAAGDKALPPRPDDESSAIWQAMVQHILDESGR